MQVLLTDLSWVNRRVETVKFTADGLVRRSVSVDFAVPEGRRVDVVAVKKTALVPVGLLRKAPLAVLDLTDESGTTIPVLGTNDNGVLAYSTLCAKALGVLGKGDAADLLPETRGLLYRIALGPPEEATKALTQLRESNDETLKEISRDAVFYKLAQDLATNFILLVEIADTDEHPSRRIVKFAYMTAPQLPRWRRVWDIVWRPNERRFSFEIPSIGEAESYHFQLAPPHGVVVVGCEGRVRPPHGEMEKAEGQVIGGAAHLHVSRAKAGTVATAEVRLSPRSHGVVLSSVVASLLIFGVIAAMWAWDRYAPVTTGVDDDWQALLIVFPGLIAGFLANQGELGLSSRLLANARGVLLASALVAFTLAGALVLGVTGVWWERLLCVGLVVSGLCFARVLQWFGRCRAAAAFTQG